MWRNLCGCMGMGGMTHGQSDACGCKAPCDWLIDWQVALQVEKVKCRQLEEQVRKLSGDWRNVAVHEWVWLWIHLLLRVEWGNTKQKQERVCDKLEPKLYPGQFGHVVFWMDGWFVEFKRKEEGGVHEVSHRCNGCSSVEMKGEGVWKHGSRNVDEVLDEVSDIPDSCKCETRSYVLRVFGRNRAPSFRNPFSSLPYTMSVEYTTPIFVVRIDILSP